jgi:hypothetical protein
VRVVAQGLVPEKQVSFSGWKPQPLKVDEFGELIEFAKSFFCDQPLARVGRIAGSGRRAHGGSAIEEHRQALQFPELAERGCYVLWRPGVHRPRIPVGKLPAGIKQVAAPVVEAWIGKHRQCGLRTAVRGPLCRNWRTIVHGVPR